MVSCLTLSLPSWIAAACNCECIKMPIVQAEIRYEIILWLYIVRYVQYTTPSFDMQEASVFYILLPPTYLDQVGPV